MKGCMPIFKNTITKPSVDIIEWPNMTTQERKEAISNLIFIINNNLTDDMDKAKMAVNHLAGIKIY